MDKAIKKYRNPQTIPKSLLGGVQFGFFNLEYHATSIGNKNADIRKSKYVKINTHNRFSIINSSNRLSTLIKAYVFLFYLLLKVINMSYFTVYFYFYFGSKTNKVMPLYGMTKTEMVFELNYLISTLIGLISKETLSIL